MEAPPTYTAELQTPPVLDLARALPNITEVQRLDVTGTNPTLTISVPVRSEDAGEPLRGVIYLDFRLAGEKVQGNLYSSAPASTFDDTTRSIGRTWSYAEEPRRGCHSLTLLVTHEPNWSFDDEKVLDFDDVALATWWLDIQEGPGTPTLTDCPRPEAK